MLSRAQPDSQPLPFWPRELGGQSGAGPDQGSQTDFCSPRLMGNRREGSGTPAVRAAEGSFLGFVPEVRVTPCCALCPRTQVALGSGRGPGTGARAPDKGHHLSRTAGQMGEPCGHSGALAALLRAQASRASRSPSARSPAPVSQGGRAPPSARAGAPLLSTSLPRRRSVRRSRILQLKTWAWTGPGRGVSPQACRGQEAAPA